MSSATPSSKAAASKLPPGASLPNATPRRRPSFAATFWLTAVWVLLWGDLTWANVLCGILVALAVTWLLPLPRVPFAGKPSPIGIFLLFARLTVDILVASIQVSVIALRLHHVPRGAVLRVELRSRSDLYLTLTADLCSVVPGSIIVEAHRATSTLYVHALDVSKEGALEHARSVVLEQEARVLYALASDTEIAAAGLPPRRFGHSSTPRTLGGAA